MKSRISFVIVIGIYSVVAMQESTVNTDTKTEIVLPIV